MITRSSLILIYAADPSKKQHQKTARECNWSGFTMQLLTQKPRAVKESEDLTERKVATRPSTYFTKVNDSLADLYKFAKRENFVSRFL